MSIDSKSFVLRSCWQQPLGIRETIPVTCLASTYRFTCTVLAAVELTSVDTYELPMLVGTRHSIVLGTCDFTALTIF